MHVLEVLATLDLQASLGGLGLSWVGLGAIWAPLGMSWHARSCVRVEVSRGLLNKMLHKSNLQMSTFVIWLSYLVANIGPKQHAHRIQIQDDLQG